MRGGDERYIDAKMRSGSLRATLQGGNFFHFEVVDGLTHRKISRAGYRCFGESLGDGERVVVVVTSNSLSTCCRCV